MRNLPNRIYIKEVGPRDGFQIEKQHIPTETKIEIIDMLSRCGFEDIQSTAFVHPKAVPNMADAEQVLAGIHRRPGVVYSALVPNFRGFQRAAAAGVRRVELTLSATDSHNINNMNMTTEQSIGMIRQCLESGQEMELIVGLAVTFGCPFEGVPPFSRLKYVLDQLAALGVKSVGLGDTSGVATPKQVYDTASRLLDAYPDIRFFFHPHNTHGNAMANIMAAMEAGITHFDASVAGLGGCPYAPGASGNIATEDLVDTMNEMGVETGIDLDALLETARLVRRRLGHSDSATLRAGKISELSAEGPHRQCNR
ncbi:MAG: hydroxymethylglutaryl-CoA lyase [Gemmiger sp.]